MAVRDPTVKVLPGGAKLVTWTGLLNGDTGAPVFLPEHGDRSVQVTGTFGVGGTCVFQGNNDDPDITPVPVNYYSLTDPALTVISFTAAGGETVLDPTVFVRPNVTAGDGTTSLTVRMYARRIY